MTNDQEIREIIDRDLMVYGVHFTQDGKRIPHEKLDECGEIMKNYMESLDRICQLQSESDEPKTA